MKALTESQVAAWKQDGFLSSFPLFDEAEKQDSMAGLERYERWIGAPVNQAAEMNWRSMSHLILPWVTKLARDPRILDRVEDLIGPDILIYTSTFFIKDPGTPAFAAWHQDSTYYGLTPAEEITVWIALSDASEEAGCMDALSFNGAPTQLRHAARVVENSVNRASQVITEPLDDTGAKAMPLQAGSFSMHHGLCAHRSGPNRAQHRRVGLGLNFIPPHVAGELSEKPAAMLVRGEDRYGHFELLSPPKAELDAEAVATHAHAIGLYHRNYIEAEARHAALYPPE